MPQLNALLNRLHDVGLIAACLISSDSVWQRSYNGAFTPTISGQVLQAVLIITGGFWKLVLGLEDYVQMNIQEVARDELKILVVSIEQCLPPEQAYIYLQCRKLFVELIKKQGLQDQGDQK